MFGAEHPLEDARGPEIGFGQQEADVEIGAGLQLDPAESLPVEEDRWQAQPPRMLLDDFGGGPDVGVEPDAEIGELGLEGGGGDQAGIAEPDQSATLLTGRVVGHRLRGHRLEGATPECRPHSAAQQSEDHDEHDQHDHREEGGDLGLIGPVGVACRPQRPPRDARAHVLEYPGADRQPDQPDGHERHQDPPCVAPEASVEGSGGHESGQRRRVAEAVHAFEPRRIVLGPLGEMSPTVTGQRPAGGSGLGVGTRTQPGLADRVVGVIGVLAGLDPDHPNAGGGVETEIDLGERLDAESRQGHRHTGVGGESRFVGPDLSDDPSLRLLEKRPERVPKLGMGGHTPLGVGGRRDGVDEVEEVAGDDQYPRAIPGIQGSGQLDGQRLRRRGRLRGEQEVAHHHHPSPDGDVDHPDTGLDAGESGPAPVAGRRHLIVGRLVAVLWWGGRRHAGPHRRVPPALGSFGMDRDRFDA